MPTSNTEAYSASCNPSRKAKRAGASVTPATAETTLPLPIHPHKTTDNQDSTPEAVPATGPAKRGRKPGPLSRAAREAQRRLNHSIIEKARRTKINDALATLRELVPPDLAQSKSPAIQPVESDGEEDIDEYQPSCSSKPKKQEKKQEKEREFKLEILIRTVAYMKDLIGRVADLEKEVNQRRLSEIPQIEPQSRKRPRSPIDDVDDETSSRFRRPRKESYVPNEGASSSSRPSPAFAPSLDGPLPSISSWLPESVIDPRLRSSKAGQSPPEALTYLPSPPSSTHFEPVRTSYLPPTLNLASMSTSSTSSSTGPLRTPEDETAASMLIQMSTSPSFRPASHSSSASLSPNSSTYHGGTASHSMEEIKLPSSPTRLTSERRPSYKSSSNRPQAQTPASLLGLTHIWRPEV